MAISPREWVSPPQSRPTFSPLPPPHTSWVQALLDSAGEALLALYRSAGAGAVWQVVLANPACESVLDLPATELPGRPVLDAMGWWHRVGLEADCQTVQDTGTALERELVLSHENGAAQVLALHLRPLPATAQGQACVLRLRDVTASRQQEWALHEKAVQLQTDNERLRDLANLDALTGLPNRRSLDALLARELSRAARAGTPLTVVMCDIDHFKAFNDFYGHLIGDDCLREVSQVLAGVMQRATDVVARYGGEEFTVVLPGTPLEGGLDVVKRIQQALHERGLPDATSPKEKLLTLSFGVAEYEPALDDSPTALLERADSALYRSKRMGRNRVGLALNESVEVLESHFACL